MIQVKCPSPLYQLVDEVQMHLEELVSAPKIEMHDNHNTYTIIS